MSKFEDSDFKMSAACDHCSRCVAVAYKDGIIAVRNTDDVHKTTLLFDKQEWADFIDGVKKGEFDFD